MGRNSYRFGMTTSCISEKGQVTIPKAVRDRLGLAAGMRLEFATENGRLVAKKVVHEDLFHKWRGAGRLPGGETVDDYLARVRG